MIATILLLFDYDRHALLVKKDITDSTLNKACFVINSAILQTFLQNEGSNSIEVLYCQN